MKNMTKTQSLRQPQPIKHSLKQKDIVYFKQVLLQKRSEILNQVDAFNSHTIVETAGKGDEGDLAASEMNLSTTLSLRERDSHGLQRINRALAKIEEGSFGLCEQCEEHVDFGRLKANPVANLCYLCQVDLEKKRRVFA